MDWQPIETAPKDGYAILAWVSGWRRAHIVYWDGEEWVGVTGLSKLKVPTHWMPLPEPPK